MSADGATRLRPWLRLVRLPLAPTAPWDAACCGALALSASGLSLAAPGVLGWLSLVLTSLALYGAGMTANDVADLERDRYRAPDRPLPSGQVRRAHAALLAVVLAALALALGGSGGDGREAAALALLLASLYDFALKRFPVLGALAMGGVRFANASLLVWPLAREGLAPWPVLLAPLATGLYAAAVTLWSTLEDEVVPGRAWAARALLVLAFLLAAAVGVWVAGGPTLGVFLAAGAVLSVLFQRTPRPGPPKRQVLEMLLALYFLGVVVASGSRGGDAPTALAVLALALGLIWGSQRLVRALRPRV